MKHISILVPKEAVMASIVDPSTLFHGVNDLLAVAGKPPVFSIQLVGMSKQVKLTNGQFSVHTNALMNDVQRTDLIIIPALGGDLKNTISINREMIPWIVDHYRKGTEVASLCIGAFLLAATGLLDGKECSSHWLTAGQFREMFPAVT